MKPVNIIDKQITDSLTQLSIVQKKAVLSVVKAFATEEEDDFDKEMNQRFSELESGAVKGFTFEESANRARKSYKTTRNKE